MRKLYIRGLAATAGALAAVAGGAVAVTAATSTPTTPSTSSTAHAHHWRPARLHGAVGVVTSDTGSDTGGVLTILQPDNKTLTISLTPNAKAWKYQGVGQKRLEESAAALPKGEVVAVRYNPKQKVHKVGFVLDLGVNGSVSG